MLRLASFVVLLAALVVSPGNGDGHAGVIALSLDELARGATVIVEGHLERATPNWREDERGRLLVTDFVLAIDSVLKGEGVQRGENIGVEAEFGRIGDVWMLSCEEARLQVGERVVLFLEPHGQRPGAWRTYGWFQGKLTVIDDRIREFRSLDLAGLRRTVAAALATEKKK